MARRTPPGIRVLLVLTPLAVVGLAFPYLFLGRDASRIDVTSDVLYALLVVHVVVAGIALVVGSLQLVPRIRANRPLHRRIGRTFLALGVLGFFVLGLPLAVTSPDGTVSRVGLVIPTLLWPWFAWQAWRAIRRRDVVQHRRWAIRLYALSWFAVTARLVMPFLLLTQLGELRAGADVGETIKSTIGVSQWLGWIIDLAFAEWVLRRGVRQRAEPALP